MIEIKDKANCCGCYGCYNICPTKAIEMVEDENGFKYPIVNKEKCVNCGLCEKVCPIINNKKEKKKDIKVYACMNKNTDTRMRSSSGGIFSLIASYILDLNGVVFGAKFNENFQVIHSYIENKEELYTFQGSKYVQTQIGEMYQKAKEFLEQDKYVLFTGTPCQIEGLYSYLGKEYEKLYTQDIICHGVPSPIVWRKYLEEFNKKYNGKPKEISFREKRNMGWSNYEMKLQYSTDSYITSHNKDIYMKAFLSDICLRDSCYACNFKKKNRNSDITLADFWGIDNIDKEMNDDKGTSLVIINSKKGNQLFEKIKQNTIYKEEDFEEAIKYNPSMINSVKLHKNRENFFKELENNNLEVLVKKYTKRPLYRRILGKIKRIIKKVIKKK